MASTTPTATGSVSGQDPVGSVPAPHHHREPAHPMLVPVLVGIGFAVSIVSALGSPMVPTVALNYGVSLNTAQWTLTAALLAGAVATPLIGKLGDSTHRRNTILGMLVLMTLGAFVAVFDGPFWLVLAGRAAQGAGMGLVALAMATARDHVNPARLAPTLSLLSVTISAGVGLGYPLSGFVADRFGFHPTFVVAGVISGLAAIASWFTLPKGDHLRERRVDPVSVVLMAVGLAAVVVAMSQMSDWGVGSVPFVGTLVAAVVVLGLWAVRELRQSDPIVDLRTLRWPGVRVANAVAFIAGVGMYFAVSLVIRYVQTPTTEPYGAGRTVMYAGMLLVPFSAASLLASRAHQRISGPIGPRWTCVVGGAIFLVALGLFAARRDVEPLFAVVTFLAGFGVSLVNASVTPMIVSSVPASETSSAMGFNAVVRLVGSAVGSAGSGAVLSAHTAAGHRYPSDHGYLVAATVGIVIWLVGIAVSRPRRGEPDAVHSG